MPRSNSRSHSRSRSYSRSRSSSRSRSKSKSPFSNRKRHVGSREDPPATKCLGVFGLSRNTKERDLRHLFEGYGEVESVSVITDNYTGESRGFAFVTMKKMHDAEDAKEALTDYELDGRHIRVDYSITKKAHSPTPGRYMGRESQRSRGYSRRTPPRRSRYSRSPSYSRSRSRTPPRYRERRSDYRY